MAMKPIASRACRRCGIPRWPATPCWRSAARAPRRRPSAACNGCALQELDVRGDWIVRRPDVRPGGRAFQYANPHYPDVDDTAVVAMAMDRAARSGAAAPAVAPASHRARW
ncbi:hypothetical protein ACU4GD_06225 [Cupriavidus basilensis]